MRHHYLPQFYSKNWANPKGSIHCYKHANGGIVEDLWAPKGTGYEHDLYSVNDEEPDKVETNHFKLVDDKASKVLNKILSSGLNSINKTEKIAWCDFIASLITRHPKILRRAEKLKIPIIRGLVNGVPKEHHQEFVSSSEVKDFCDNIHTYAIASFSGYDEQDDIGLNEKYRECLSALNWFILDFSNTGFDLLTCDYPACISPLNEQVLKLSQFKTPRDMLDSGYFYLSLPLSPTQCFYAGKIEPTKEITKSKLRYLIKIQNYRTIRNAQKTVYSNASLSMIFLNKYFKAR